MKQLITTLLLAASIHCYAAHRLNKREAQRYLENMDTIVLNHAGTDRIVFNYDTIFIKMEQPPAVCNTSAEQRWLDRHPVLFTFMVALFTVLTEVQLLKLALKK